LAESGALAREEESVIMFGIKRQARIVQRRVASPATCRSCVHFDNDPGRLEQAIHGLNTLSSAYASVRADDGLCARHDRYVRASFCCDDFMALSRNITG
jgi:hypothetical protein